MDFSRENQTSENISRGEKLHEVWIIVEGSLCPFKDAMGSTLKKGKTPFESYSSSSFVM